jgi:geranylgeranyl pyrophosphate synthase/predicted secreted hydrolase
MTASPVVSAEKGLRAIDLAIDDLPHPETGKEWWYFNFHVADSEGREYAAFLALFRAASLTASDSPVEGHSLAWAIVDPAAEEYFCESVLDSATAFALHDTLSNDQVLDSKFRESLIWSLRDGIPPLPDRLVQGNVSFASDRLDIRFGTSATITRTSCGEYSVIARGQDGSEGFSLTVHPTKPPVWQGDDGQVGEGDHLMHYYSITNCAAAGSLQLHGSQLQVRGSAWYDHEFGHSWSRCADGLPASDASWIWTGIQLSNGCELSFSTWWETNQRTGESRITGRPAIIVDEDGVRIPIDEHTLTQSLPWTSPRTFNSYPQVCRIEAPDHGIDLLLTSEFSHQETCTLIVGFGFWEGRVKVAGTVHGEPVEGVGFVEVLPVQWVVRLEEFLSRVGAETRTQIHELYPDQLTSSGAEDFIDKVGGYDTSDLQLESIHACLVAPVRHLLDAGGKYWRSYLLAVVLDFAGVADRVFRPLLGTTELLHTAGLIVDDIEDESPLRRGAPSTHMRYGLAPALNAANAAYFCFDRTVARLRLDPTREAGLYRVYCGMMRAAHVGQAADIAGLSDVMTRAIDASDSSMIERAVHAVHRLKTAAPIRSIADVANVLAGLSSERYSALANYLEGIGIAYQIIDDVIDIRGGVRRDVSRPERQLKVLGDDIRNGMVGYPLAVAAGLLGQEDMRLLWKIVQSRPQEPEVINECIALLETCGAVDACVDQARDLVDRSWRRLEPWIDHSRTAVLLRAMGSFCIYRFEEMPG